LLILAARLPFGVINAALPRALHAVPRRDGNLPQSGNIRSRECEPAFARLSHC